MITTTQKTGGSGTPHFGAWIGCKWCAALGRELAPDVHSWPATARAPAVEAILEPVRAAATALSKPIRVLGERDPSATLIAVHAGVETWHDLRLGAPPDGRPLYVGTVLPDEVDRFWGRDRLQLAEWSPAASTPDRGRVLNELLVRWQPPLNREVATPWNRAP